MNGMKEQFYLKQTHTHIHTHSYAHSLPFLHTYTHTPTQTPTQTPTHPHAHTHTNVPMMTASNLNPGMRMTTSKMGWDPAPDNVQHTTSDFSKHTLTLIRERFKLIK